MLFSRTDRTFQLELVREGAALVEWAHTGDKTKTRLELETEHQAVAGFGRRVAELVDDGWTVAWIDEDWAVAREHAMEEAIHTTETDLDERLAVYNDWLIERGDPCGELAALRVRQGAPPSPLLEQEIEEYEKAHGLFVYGPLMALARAHRESLEFEWLNGWIHSIEIDERVTASVATLAFHAPIARFLRRVVIGQRWLHALPSAIAMSPQRDTVRELEMQARPERAQELLDALPGLIALGLLPGTPTKRGHDRVRILRLKVIGAQPTTGEYELVSGDDVDDDRAAPEERWVQLSGSWPALAELMVEIVGPASAPLQGLAELDAPQLEKLTIYGAGRGPAAAATSLLAIKHSPFVSRLRRMLVAGPLSADAYRALCDTYPWMEIVNTH